jgi:hypothetical protein
VRLDYSITEAQQLSRKGNPVPLFALGIQGMKFARGETMPLGTSSIVRFNTGVILTNPDTTVFAVVMSKQDTDQSNITLAGGSFVLPRSNQFPILIPMTSISTSLVEYGTHIADLYFLKGV